MSSQVSNMIQLYQAFGIWNLREKPLCSFLQLRVQKDTIPNRDPFAETERSFSTWVPSNIKGIRKRDANETKARLEGLLV